MGESIIDVMYKPFLIDQGISASTGGLCLGPGDGRLRPGLCAGWSPRRPAAALRMLLIVGAMRLPSWGSSDSLRDGGVSDVHVIGGFLAEHLIGGALTTVMFATMMGMVDRRIGATHFALRLCGGLG